MTDTSGTGTPSPAGLNFPALGVLCDGGASICYDQRGGSIPLTQTYFGSLAAQRLSSSLAGRAPQQQFVLSNGVYCNLADRRCWSDGWNRRQPDTVLSNRLFNAETTTAGRSITKEDGLCTLSQGGVALFSGGCGLSLVSQSGTTRYVVRLTNGTTYNFSNRSGQFQLIDSYGTWPVTISNQGNTGLFRWRDVQLSATRQGTSEMPYNGSPNGSGPYSGGAVNPALGGVLNLIQSLFR
ncbi:YcgJ family protein [Cyanobium sp. Morenito 9A2]|uniref:YcgJ family protein n=1 Tax=Cyanobium sp. Morenito 9A2 TaxID=2823718 RepID=UPI0020CCC173|nr:YcgJ family protein [Cyanobium sp. Morenito 9A2]